MNTIQEILLTEEQISTRVQELGAQISADYQGQRFSAGWHFKRERSAFFQI